MKKRKGSKIPGVDKRRIIVPMATGLLLAGLLYFDPGQDRTDRFAAITTPAAATTPAAQTQPESERDPAILSEVALQNCLRAVRDKFREPFGITFPTPVERREFENGHLNIRGE